MGEVLSQSEIDNLLAALSAGELDVDQMQETDERQVKDYDFRRPTKFSKEHLRTLEIIFEHYSRLISTNLPVYLRKNVQVSVSSSETVTFNEFTNALSNPVILGIINFAPLNGQIIVDLATNLGYAMLDRMLGGSGIPLEKSRDFSEIELTIIQKILIMFTQLLRDPWKNVIDINPVLQRLETNPQFAQVIAPNDMIAIITLTMKIGDVEGFMNILIHPGVKADTVSHLQAHKITDRHDSLAEYCSDGNIHLAYQRFNVFLIIFIMILLHGRKPILGIQLIHDIFQGKERKTDIHKAFHIPNLHVQRNNRYHVIGGDHLRELGIRLQTL